MVEPHGDKVVTTSLKVAEYFGKRHDDVLKAIRVLLSDKVIEGRRNFAESSYFTDQNKTMPMYELDRDGFTLLAMGFTGKQALQFKLSYIDAFNRLNFKGVKDADIYNRSNFGLAEYIDEQGKQQQA